MGGIALTSQAAHTSGYVPRWPAAHRIYNVVVAFIFLVMAAPLLAVISFALLVTQGTEIFYRGPRLGHNGRIFNIVKFRSLDSEKAKALTRDDVLRDGTDVETPLGGFLRATRLDELPQLFNVLLGDMNLIGPRPVRPELAEIYRDEIPHYDVRFAVKPGLLGRTQALMSHGTSKHVRARYNFVSCRGPLRYRDEFTLIVVVGSCVAATALKRFAGALGLTGGRDRARGVSVQLEEAGGRAWPVLGWTQDTLMLGGQAPELTLGTACDASLRIRLPDGQIRRARVALSMPTVCAPNARDAAGGRAVVKYSFAPRSEYSEHVVSRYLHQAVVTPHKSLLLVPRIRRRLKTMLQGWGVPATGEALDRAA